VNREDLYSKRRYERIPANQGVCFFDSSGRHLAKLLDCSAEGMLIETRDEFPLDQRLELIIFTGKEMLNIPACVVRVNKKGNRHVGVGLQVMDSTERYIQFVIRRALRDVPE